MTDWAREIVAACLPIAERLDATLGGDGYRQAWNTANAALDDPSRLPSAAVIAAMAQDPASGHAGFGLARSAEARNTLLALELPSSMETMFAQQAAASIEEQAGIEAADTLSFEAFRQDYMSPEHLVV